MADDLEYGDLGCYGQADILTPEIDRLAGEALRFTQAYARATVCAPSRCCLMTGLHGGHSRIRGNKRVPLTTDDVTVGDVLKKAGYATAIEAIMKSARVESADFPVDKKVRPRAKGQAKVDEHMEASSSLHAQPPARRIIALEKPAGNTEIIPCD